VIETYLRENATTIPGEGEARVRDRAWARVETDVRPASGGARGPLVEAREDTTGNKRLVAYVVQLTPDRRRNLACVEHQRMVVPADSLPRTA